MILRKYMSLIGIGSARIDLILPKDTYCPGENIKGYFLIKGGTIEQLIKQIDCDLVMTDLGNGDEGVIDTFTVLTSKVIQSEECNQIFFSFNLPSSIPLSTEERTFRFKTRLAFHEGVESKDQDIIQIIPEYS